MVFKSVKKTINICTDKQDALASSLTGLVRPKVNKTETIGEDLPLQNRRGLVLSRSRGGNPT
jgi:hypothetical protein